jgi:hypothetical protein
MSFKCSIWRVAMLLWSCEWVQLPPVSLSGILNGTTCLMWKQRCVWISRSHSPPQRLGDTKPQMHQEKSISPALSSPSLGPHWVLSNDWSFWNPPMCSNCGLEELAWNTEQILLFGKGTGLQDACLRSTTQCEMVRSLPHCQTLLSCSSKYHLFAPVSLFCSLRYTYTLKHCNYGHD